MKLTEEQKIKIGKFGDCIFLITIFLLGLFCGFMFFKNQYEDVLNSMIPCLNFCVSSPDYNYSLKHKLISYDIDYDNITKIK